MIEPRRPFQFSLRMLLLLCVVLASSMGVFGASGIVVFVLVVGLAICLRGIQWLMGCAGLVVALFCLWGISALLLPLIQRAREHRNYSGCRNNLEQIADALLLYEQSIGSFPPTYIVDNSGKPVHSWRILIAPCMWSVPPIAKMYDRTKPWDAPQNTRASSERVVQFECPSDSKAKQSPPTAHTNYFAVVGANAAWAGEKPRKLADFDKHGSDTIMVVEVADSDVAFVEPTDFSLDALGVVRKSRTLPLSSHHRPEDEFFYTYDRASGVNVATVDGATYFLRTDNLSPDELRKILQIGGFTDDVKQSQGDYRADGRLNWPNIAALAVWLGSVVTLLAAALRSRKVWSVPPPGPTAA